MEDINNFIKALFENSCYGKPCDDCKLKDECKAINQFIKDIKNKGLTNQQIARAISLFIFILRERKHIADFGTCHDSIIKEATTNRFEVDWLINRYESILDDKDELKPIIAVFPEYVKDMIRDVVNNNLSINTRIANHIIRTSEIECKEILNLLESKKEDNKLKNFSDKEIEEEFNRRQNAGK
jgi:methionine synthase II (cobalamin-independent)